MTYFCYIVFHGCILVFTCQGRFWFLVVSVRPSLFVILVVNHSEDIYVNETSES